jgi:glycerophosphoryl diester phosphodiesterase
MKIIGHAGARGLAPANTIEGFKKAIATHVDAIEFDVRVTKDSVPVLYHDRFVLDPSGKRLLIAEQTLRSLRKYLPDLATLEGALRIMKHGTPLHVEIKPAVVTQPIIATIQQFLDKGWRQEEFYYASFDQRILLAMHYAFPKSRTIVLHEWSRLVATRRARQLGTKYISMNQRVLWRPLIRSLTRRGYRLGAYTVNTTRQAHRFEKAGIYSVVTDFPDRFVKK